MLKFPKLGWSCLLSELSGRATEAIRAIVIALVVRSREPVERHVVLCRDDLVDLTIGFLIVQVVNFLVRQVPEVTLPHHVSRKTSHLILLDRYGTKNRSGVTSPGSFRLHEPYFR